MQFDDYQEQVHRYVYQQSAEKLALGLVSKVGKLSAVIATGHSDDAEAILGEVLHHLAELANELGYSLDMVAVTDLKALSKVDDEAV